MKEKNCRCETARIPALPGFSHEPKHRRDMKNLYMVTCRSRIAFWRSCQNPNIPVKTPQLLFIILSYMENVTKI